MVKLLFKNNEWITLPKYSREGTYIDGFLKKKVDMVKKLIEDDWDVLCCVDGAERSGKSRGIAQKIAYYYLNTKISLNNIASSTEDALKKIEILPDGSCMILDEASLTFLGSDANTSEQKQFRKLLNVIGQRNLFFILVSPSYFELNKYIATHRCKFLVHVYTDSNMKRGRFAYFPERSLKALYFLGKKNFNSYPRNFEPEFYGTFSDFKLPFDDQYEELKRESYKRILLDKKDRIQKKDWRPFIDKMIENRENMSDFHKKKANNLVISKLTGLGAQTIGAYYQDFLEKREK